MTCDSRSECMQEKSAKLAEDVKQEKAHAKAVSTMFGRIVTWYDLLNTVLSCGFDRLWRRRLVREVRLGPTGRVLDLAAGTMDLSLAIRKRYPKAIVPALDFCPPMLLQGRKKLKGNHAHMVWPVAADARHLPLPDASVDCITIGFGIRNVLPRSEAFAEMHRVLVPGGRVCILEFGSGKNKIWGGFYNFYLRKLLPKIGKIFSGDPKAYEYLANTIIAFPTARELEEELRAAGFVCAWHVPLTSGIVCMHMAEKACAEKACTEKALAEKAHNEA